MRANGRLTASAALLVAIRRPGGSDRNEDRLVAHRGPAGSGRGVRPPLDFSSSDVQRIENVTQADVQTGEATVRDISGAVIAASPRP